MTARMLVSSLAVSSMLVLGGADPAVAVVSAATQPVSLRVDARVTNDGMSIAGLGPDDFAVTDNGAPLHVERLEVHPPLNVVIVFELRPGFFPTDRERLAATAGAWLDHLSGSDTAALVTFTDQIQVVVAPTANRAAVRAALSALPPVPAAAKHAVWDAALVGAGLVAGRAGRPVVLLASDLDDDSSWVSERPAIDLLIGAGLLVDVLEPRSGAFIVPPRPWPALAAGPGGVAIDVTDSRADGLVADRVAALHAGYSLTVSPAAGGAEGLHQLRVTLTHAKGTVSARRGYFPNRPSS